MGIRQSTPLVLASSSPRRQELLRRAGLEFTCDPPHIPEVQQPGEPPLEFALRLAREKAREVAARHPGTRVLGADTIVVVDGEVLGKPEDAADAARMLRLLSGRDHTVTTAICLVEPDGTDQTTSVTTRVWMRSIFEDEMARYISTGEPMDKAGAYGIQGGASPFIERIEGEYDNVVGLPVKAVLELLQEDN